MSYVAPDGNSYKYKYRINSYGSPSGTSSYYIIVYSNYKVCFCKEVDGSHRYYYYTTAYKFNDGIVRLCGIQTVASTKTYKNGYSTGLNPGYDAYSYGSMGDNDDAFSWNWDCMAEPSFAQTQTDFPIFDTKQEALAYVTEPEVFQIPSFSFSGSILQGQNSSLSQGSCSLASPYTTSFSFEGKYKEFVDMFYDDMITHNPFVNGLATMEKNAANLSQLQTIIEAWKTNSTKHLSVHFTGPEGAYDSGDPYQTWKPKNAVIFILANAFSAGSYVGGDYYQTVYPVYTFNGSTWSTYTSNYDHRIIVRKPASTTDYYTDFDTYSNYMS